MAGEVPIRELFAFLGVKADTEKVNEYDKALGKVKKTMGVVVGAAIAVGAAFLGIAYSTSEAGSAVKDASERIGVGTDALQEWTYAAKLAGAEATDVEVALRNAGKSAAGAASGNKQLAQAYRDLHVSQAVLKSGKPEEVLEAIADGLTKIEDPGRRSDLIMATLGKGGIRMAGLLKQGSAAIAQLRKEAHDLGYVLDKEAIENADEFGDEMDRTKAVLTGLKNQIGAALLPVLRDGLKAFRDWYMANRELVQTRVREFVDGVVTSLRVFGRIMLAVDHVVSKTIGWRSVFLLFGAAVTLVAGLKAWKTLQETYAALIVITKAFGITSAEAWLTALGPIGLFIAAVVAAGLVLEDLYVYFEGGESAFGHFLDNFAASEGPMGSFARGLEYIVSLLEASYRGLKMLGSGIGQWLTDPAKAFGNFSAGLSYVTRRGADKAGFRRADGSTYATLDERIAVGQGMNKAIGGRTLSEEWETIARQGETGVRENYLGGSRRGGSTRTTVIENVRAGDINLSGVGISEEAAQKLIERHQQRSAEELLDEIEGRDL